MIQRILHFDFPGKWPSFTDVTLRLLHANDPSSVLAGLQCLLVTCRAFRFKGAQDNGRAEFDKVVEASFPRLLQICNELVNQESDEAGEMLHIALKAYKHATWVRQHTTAIRLSMAVWVSNCCLPARAPEFPAPAPGQHWLVHYLLKHRLQVYTRFCYARRHRREGTSPLVEG